MAGFVKKYSLSADPDTWVKEVVIANSETLKVGTWAALSSGFAKAATAGDTLAGVVIGIVTKDGTSLLNATSGQDYDGTYTHTEQSYTAAADNQTDKQVKVVLDTDPFGVWSSEPDDTIGTTTSSGSSDEYGSFTDLADYETVDENNAGNAFNVKAQLLIMGVDPDNSSNGLYMPAEHYYKVLA